MLSREPETYTVGSILKLVETSVIPVACLGCEDNSCERASDCRTLPMWQKLNGMVDEFFESVTLADLCENNNL